MTILNPRWLCFLGGAALVLGGGCRSQAPVAVAVPDVSLTHYAGTPLARAEIPATGPTLSDALGIEIRAYLLPATKGTLLRPFASGAKVVTASGSEAPLLAIPSSLADARIGFGAEARQIGTDVSAGTLGPVVDLGERHAALAAGISAQMRIAPATAQTGGHPQGFQEIELVFSRSAGADVPLRLALTRQSLYVPAEQENGPAVARLPQPRRETAVTTMGYAQGQNLELALVVPANFTPGEKQMLLMLVRISPGSEDPAHVAAVQAANRDLTTETAKSESASYEQLVLGAALRAAETVETRRAALVYLATQGPAPILLDAALVADDGVLEQLVTGLREMTARPDAMQQQALGWTLDRFAFDTMGKLLIEKKLSPELRAVLSKHAGQAGLSAAAMDQLIGRTLSRRDLENRLIAENYIFLEDISPAARVRAYDWLKAMGNAPPGYDPLGPVEQRRKALEAAIEQMAQRSGEGK